MALSEQKKKHLSLSCGTPGVEVVVEMVFASGAAVIVMVVKVLGRELIVRVELEPSIVESRPVALGSMGVEEEGYVNDGVDRSEAVSACAARLRRSRD